MTNAVLIWWSTLCAVAALNIVGWSLSARSLARHHATLPPSIHATRRLILWLAAGYVLGCAFRSVLPMVDVPRMCLHDTPLSRIAIGRSVATIAELCFAAQFALLLREAGRGTHSRAVERLGPTVFALIVVAELLSWAAVLTRNFVLHAVENSLWTLAAVLGVVAFGSLRSRVDARAARFVVGVLVCGAAYIAFMSLVDVPMYLARWHEAAVAGDSTLSLAQGLREILARCTVVRDRASWSDDIPWLTLYFSTAVWISIALPHAPPLASQRAHSGAALRDFP